MEKEKFTINGTIINLGYENHKIEGMKIYFENRIIGEIISATFSTDNKTIDYTAELIELPNIGGKTTMDKFKHMSIGAII